jgi:hypothetical protein
MNEVLPIAGAGAVGLLALAGAGLALRRRRRRREELEAEEQWVAAEESRSMAAEPVVEPDLATAPAFATAAAAPAAAPRHDPVDETAPTTALPEGFDLSRFGRHVQAAYRGPTPDNPSLSLKYRLRKATALDQRERTEAETKIEPVAQKPDEGGFMLKGDKSKTMANAYSR